MLQARQLGKELYVGVHSDEEILLNKGPVVMKMDERVTAVEACKWSTEVIPGAPYVTDPKVMDKYDCKYVVHGDDITTDADGEDCYQLVKDLGRFVVVKRTPNISTTDLVGRMLLMDKVHHYASLENCRDVKQHDLFKQDNLEKFKSYASDESGLQLSSSVYVNSYGNSELTALFSSPKPFHKISYVDGGFDLFHPGHIELLKVIAGKAKEDGSTVLVGIHDDPTINKIKGLNYPIMNIFERSLCVLQCRYVDGIILGAPYKPSSEFLEKIPGKVIKVYHGPTPIIDNAYDETKEQGLYAKIGRHKYDDMNTQFIVDRVLKNKEAYEERQKRKGWKSERELLLQQQLESH